MYAFIFALISMFGGFHGATHAAAVHKMDTSGGPIMTVNDTSGGPIAAPMDTSGGPI